MHYRQLLALASVGALGIIGCDAGQFTTGVGGGEVQVRVSVDLANTAIAGVAVEVTGPGIGEPIVANLPINDGMANGTVVVLAGSSRAFNLRAFDAQGLETHRGADTVDIAAEGTTELEVGLTPLVGSVGIGARIGDYSVSVSSPGTPLSVGQSVQLDVTVLDAYGATVTDAQVAWGSLNPAVASVNSDGVVEALVPGTTTIGASYKGFSGTSTITVQ